MNPNPISQDDLILFALDDLTPAEASEGLLHLQSSESAREELAHIYSSLATYAMTSEMRDPPALARERLMAQVSREQKSASKVVAMQRPAEQTPAQDLATREPAPMPQAGRIFAIEQEPVQRSGVGFLGWAGWAIAAGCALVAGFEFRQHQSVQNEIFAQSVKLDTMTAQSARAQEVMKLLTDGGAMQVALHLPTSASPEPPKPEGHAAYIADSGKLVFVGMHLKPLEIYKTYELWVIPADGQAPIPAGIFKPDARGFASVILPELPKGIAAKTFGVTIEEDGGSKAPTSPIVLAGL